MLTIAKDAPQDPVVPLFLGEGAASEYSCRLKHCLKQMIAGGTPTSSNEAYWTTSADPAGVSWVAISDMTRAFRICSTEKSVTEAGIQAARLTKLPVGTILYSIYASLGKTAILETEAVTNQAILGLVPNESKVRKRFLGWWLAHVEPMVSLLSSSNTQSNLNAEKVENIPVFVPPLPTQEAIANFLDRKTAAIDTLIEKKEKLLELLAEKRSALINQAVTKGLDPNVPMKDSGIPWIGEIPEHWEVKAVKRLSNFVTSGPRGWGQYYSEHGPIFLRIGNVSRDRIDLLLSELQSVSPPSNAEGLRTRTKGGDILVSITADIGSVGVVPDGLAEAYVSQHLALVRPEAKKVLPRFLAYSARGPWATYHFGALMQGGTKVGLTLDDVRNLKIGLPPRVEQLEIQEFLDTKLQLSFGLSNQVSKQMKALTEYRQSLITAAVTGQLEIPVSPSARQDYE